MATAGLWGTEDGGKTWSKLGSGAGSAQITNRISAIVYDPEHPGTFWESGIYNGGGVYRTTDHGKTFEQLGDVTHCDSVSVDFSDPERKTLLAGTHEQSSKLFRSLDGGKTWQRVLYRGPNIGASDIEIDPQRPEIVYAALWEERVAPWEDGNEYSGAGGGLSNEKRPLVKPMWEFKPGGKCGTLVSDLFPHLREKMDDICLIKSMKSDDNEHYQATLAMHTGSFFFTRPSIGAWLSYGLGTINQNLPSA